MDNTEFTLLKDSNIHMYIWNHKDINRNCQVNPFPVGSMGEKVNIIDDFFDIKDFDLIIEKIKNIQYICKCVHNHNSAIRNDIPYWRVDLSEDIFFTDYLSTIINHKLNTNYKLKRVYITSQTYEQNSNYHIDCTSSTSITICLYISSSDIIKTYNHFTHFDIEPSVNISNSGYIYIKFPNNNIMTIESNSNRLVSFPSTYYHKGEASCNDNLRICIAWKFENVL